MITFDPIDGKEGQISPSAPAAPKVSQDKTSVDALADIDGSINDAKVTREGKFLVYWMTTTSITTITSYSSTFSLGSIHCTPSGYELSECGKK